MFISKKHISRRTVLKGAGVALGLPFLDAMVPAATPLAQTAAAPRLRAGFFYLPHGAVQGDTKLGPEADRWTPSGSGANFKLNAITSPLEPFKKYVSTVGNLNNPGGAGVHTRNPGTWLNCGSGTTIDQIIAQKIGRDTRLPSLEVASETTIGPRAGNGTVTGRTISFRDANTPLEMEYNPRTIFNRLFGTETSSENYSRLQQMDSFLDLIRDSTKDLQRDLGAHDKAVLDDYLEGVRKLEQQTKEGHARAINPSTFTVERPAGVLDEFDKQVKLIFDLIAAAYQADITRVASYFMVQEGSNQTYKFIGVDDSFHPLSHHANDPAKIDIDGVSIQTWHMAKFAEFLQKMAATPDGDGTLLDHSIFLYGSNMGNSDKHSNWPLPTVVVGGGNGRMKLGGQHIDLKERTPLSNVHLTLLNKAGIEQTKFADSTGTISEL